MRVRLQARLLLAAALVLPGSLHATELFPLEELRAGMQGIGRTVFEGTRVDEFRVHVLGVLENTGPKQSLVIARLEGGPLANTGVIAGMSGSPVFIDGRLLGAVAYGFPFSKETIAGITPIGEMIAATTGAAVEKRTATSRLRRPWGAQGPAQPLDRETLVAALGRQQAGAVLEPGSWRGESLPGSLAGMTLRPLALPLSFSGFDPTAFEWARGLFSALGFSPLRGTGGGGQALPQHATPDLQPGSAVGISLVEGDLDISVTGTVTHIDGQRLYAFGHPFYNLGPTRFPLKTAYVHSIFPSLYQSWKISSSGADTLGTMDQDRLTAVSGRLGAPPRMIPVEVNITTSRGSERQFAFRIVEDELFSPVLAYLSVLSVLQSNERAYGTASVRVSARLLLDDGREVHVDDLFTRDQPATQAAALVGAPLVYLLSNDFEPVNVARVEVDATSHETIRSATLQRVWLERRGPLRPGSTVPLKIQLRTYRGQRRVETIPLTIPPNAPPGTYRLLVADAASLNRIEQVEMRQPFVPRDLDQLLRAINGLRRSSHVYARLVRPEAGAIVSGEYLPSLPPSVLAILRSGGTVPDVVPIHTTAVWDFDLPTTYAISGSRWLAVKVTR